MNLKFELNDEQAQQAQGLKSGDVTFDLEIANLNKPQNIAAPANAKPFSELQGALGSLAGGLGTIDTDMTPEQLSDAGWATVFALAIAVASSILGALLATREEIVGRFARR